MTLGSRNNVESRARDLLERGLANGVHIGYALFVSLRGEPVLDIAGGLARKGADMSPSHRVRWLCCSKPVVAVALVKLAAEGRWDLDEPVSAILPEFGANGKNKVTARHLLTHTVPFARGAHRPTVTLMMDSDDDIYRAICQMGLGCRPGEVPTYEVLRGWHVVGELIARVSGEPTHDYVRRAVLEPIGASLSSLGVPDGVAWESLPVLHSCEQSKPVPAALFEMRTQVTRRWPGFGMRGPMSDLGHFLEALMTQDERVLPSPWCARVTAPARVGLIDERFLLNGSPSDLAWGLGVVTDPRAFGRHCSADTFGHLGAGSVFAFADPAHSLVVACHFNGVLAEPDDYARRFALVDQLYEDLFA